MAKYTCGQCRYFKTENCTETNRNRRSVCDDFYLNPVVPVKNDPVNPNHYKNTYAKEVIDLIQASLTPEEFRGYCKGNMLKYRFRAGYKGDRDEDLKKSNWYQDKLKEVSDED